MARSVFRFFTENVGRLRSFFCYCMSCKTKSTEKNRVVFSVSFSLGNRKTDPSKLGFGLRKPTEKLTDFRFFWFSVRNTVIPHIYTTFKHNYSHAHLLRTGAAHTRNAHAHTISRLLLCTPYLRRVGS